MYDNVGTVLRLTANTKYKSPCGHCELDDQLLMRNRKVPVCVPGVLRHPVRTQTTETTGQCVGTTASVPAPVGQYPGRAREICHQCAGEMSSTFTNSFKHLMNVLKLRKNCSCLGWEYSHV